MPPFRELIKTRFSRMLEEHGGTAKELAKQLGMTEVNFSRYKNHGCAIDSPNAKSLLDIISTSKLEYSGLMTHYFPKEAAIWREVYGDRGYSNESKSLAVNRLVKDEALSYYLFTLAGLRSGLPIEFIDRCWAQNGFESLREFTEKSLLKADDIVAHRENKSHSYGDLNVVKQHIRFLAKDFPIGNILLGEGAMANATGNLNPEGVRAVSAKSKASALEVLEMINDPKYQGDIPVSFSLLAGKMKNADLYAETVQNMKELRNEEKDNEK